MMAYIYRTSFVVGNERYFVLFDDAMISMRYARNLAHGYGLVWNPGGERVEGYTNPLWVLFMAGFHLLPIAASKMSLLVQMSGGIFLLANLFFVKKISEHLSSRPFLAILAVLMTAFYTPLNNWGLQGMEVSVLTLILSAAAWLSLKHLRQRSFSPWVYVWLGMATWVRMDMTVPYLLLLLFLTVAVPEHRRSNLLWGGGLLLLFLGSQTLFRLFYYGEWLPNTYYLKVSGYSTILRLKRGGYALLLFILNANWFLFLLPFIVLLFKRDRSGWLPALLVLGQLAYSVYVGGDAWEHKGGANRYIAIAMPLFFILFIYAFWLSLEALTTFLKKESRWWQSFANLILLLLTLASMANFNFFKNVKSLERWMLMRQPVFIEGNKEYVKTALALKRITLPRARIAVVSAGAIPYFSDRIAIDLLGKNDKFIARQPAHVTSGPYNLEAFRPGHMKWDYDYSIGELQPDVVVQLWKQADKAQSLLKRDYVKGEEPGGMVFWLRRDSKNIRWENVKVEP
jgi:hypothetical protein